MLTLKINRLILTISTAIGWLLVPTAGAHMSEEKTAIESRFEFRGAMQLGEVWRFSLHDTKSQLSFWLELGKTRRGLQALDFDSESSLLTVQYNERRVSLPIVPAGDLPLEVATSLPNSRGHIGKKEHVLTGAPTFTPPSPPNGGRPPNSSPPEKQPNQPRL